MNRTPFRRVDYRMIAGRMLKWKIREIPSRVAIDVSQDGT